MTDCFLCLLAIVVLFVGAIVLVPTWDPFVVLIIGSMLTYKLIEVNA